MAFFEVVILGYDERRFKAFVSKMITCAFT